MIRLSAAPGEDLGGDGRRPGTVVLVVADGGPGIAEVDMPHVFDRFYQADASVTRPYEGTGIGLALVKELVELHGGSVTAESLVGRGSTFTVRLPLGDGSHPLGAAGGSLNDVIGSLQLFDRVENHDHGGNK